MHTPLRDDCRSGPAAVADEYRFGVSCGRSPGLAMRLANLGAQRVARCALKQRIGLIGLGARLVYARYIEPFSPKLERYRMDLPWLGRSLEGLRVLHISDLHVSARIPLRFLRDQIERCTAMQPDLLLITGDFLTCARPRHVDAAARLVARARARYGVFAVLGNHDFNVRLRSLPAGGAPRVRRQRAENTGDRLAQRLRDSGVTVLRNECHKLELGGGRLQLVGLDDLWSGLFDAERAFEAVDPYTPCLALSHNPESIHELCRRPCHWVLSGHTHGGQVRFHRHGPVFLPRGARRYAAGLYDVDGTRLYVNRGLGYTVKMRYNCRPEIAEFTLARR